MRFEKKPELLAPAGTMEAIVAVIDAGADAVYIGGKTLNMRMHRASYSFDDRQMAAAIELVHQRKRRIYITLNSLVLENELPQLRSELATLGRLCPDGIIVADLAVASMAREICVHVPLHASTMMNVHSVESAMALKLMGFLRIVTSRDIPLHQVRRIAEGSGLEMEYFIHGDMCIAESSQCYGSGLLFGESSNRGRCMKSCRWQWSLVPPTGVEVSNPESLQGYLLARKDMCMFQQIPALIHNGIASLKIEGRMRSADFLRPLVAAYRQAIDAYCANPAGYVADESVMADLTNRRVREFSTCMAMHNPGVSSVDASGAREPRFFSLAKKEPEVAPAAPEPVFADPGGSPPELAVHVASALAAEAAAGAGANAIYLGGDCSQGGPEPLDVQWLVDFARRNAGRGIRTVLLGTRIADDRDLEEWRWLLRAIGASRDVGVGVSSLGALLVAREMRFRNILADFSMNISNSQAADELSTQGVTRITASLELESPDLAELTRNCRLPVEIIGQGLLPAMVMDHCVVAAATGHTANDVCPMNCRKGQWNLRDTAGQKHRIECDRRCRNHLYMARDVCMLSQVGRMAELCVAAIRIEAQFDSPEAVTLMTAAYRKAIDQPARPAGEIDHDIAVIASAIGRPLGASLITSDCAV